MDENNLSFQKLKEILRSQTPEPCSVCGGLLKVETIKLDQLEKDKLYVLEDAPAFVCQQCGEVWVPKQVLNELDKMIELTTKKTGKNIKENKK